MTEYQLEAALKEVATEAQSAPFEMQNEASAYERIEDMRDMQHAHSTVHYAAEALIQALVTRRRIMQAQDNADSLRITIDNLSERIEEFDLDEYVRLQAVEADHKHNTAIVNKMRDELALLVDTSKGMRRVRRYVGAPRD